MNRRLFPLKKIRFPRHFLSWESAAFSWLLLALVQIGVAWGRWNARDMTAGDTAGYYRNACRWLENGDWLALAIAPFYKLYLALWIALVQHPFWVVHLHRLGIYALEGALLLLLLRRLLPRHPALAFLGALAWILNPASLDSLYEVHLFALSVLLSLLVCLTMPSPRWRAAGCALLLVTSLFVRLEYSLFLAAALIFPCREDLRQRLWRPYLIAFGTALMVSVCLIVLLGHGKPGEWLGKNGTKTQLQFGQAYAVYYAQTHPEWQQDPFLAYQEVNREVFGSKDLGLGTSLLRNPPAVTGFVFHNMQGFADGVQLLWFDRTSARVDPSGDPVRRPARWVWLPFAVLLFFASTGFRSLWRSPASPERNTGLVFSAALPLALLTTAIQRAVPIYMLPLGPLTCYFVILGWLYWRGKGLRAGLIAALVLIPAFAWVCRPCWLTPKKKLPLSRMVCCLWPHRDAIRTSSAPLAVPDYEREVVRYLYTDFEPEFARPGEAWSDPALWKRYLESTSANWLYADQALLQSALPRAMKEQVEAGQWEWVFPDETKNARWALFKRSIEGLK